MSIEFIGVNKFFAENHVLKDINLNIEEGEFLTLLGPSGCGKTTTLRMIAGLERPEQGKIMFNGREVDNAETNFHLDSAKRHLSMVFQSYALWPHMTVYQNIAFGLEIKKIPSQKIKGLVSKALEKMHISDLISRYPSELSGGQQQRVAIARAIVTEPKVLLLDEPLSNLDAKLSMEMRNELKRLHQELNITMVYVTHDQQEALTLSTRIAVFFDGEILQIDKPRELYRMPASLRVAEFIGNSSLNIINAHYKNHGPYGVIRSAWGEFEVSPLDISNNQDVNVIIKPEDITIYKQQQQKTMEAKVLAVFPQGPVSQVQLKIGNQFLTALTIGRANFEANTDVWVALDYSEINIYDKQTGKRLN